MGWRFLNYYHVLVGLCGHCPSDRPLERDPPPPPRIGQPRQPVGWFVRTEKSKPIQMSEAVVDYADLDCASVLTHLGFGEAVLPADCVQVHPDNNFTLPQFSPESKGLPPKKRFIAPKIETVVTEVVSPPAAAPPAPSDPPAPVSREQNRANLFASADLVLSLLGKTRISKPKTPGKKSPNKSPNKSPSKSPKKSSKRSPSALGKTRVEWTDAVNPTERKDGADRRRTLAQEKGDMVMLDFTNRAASQPEGELARESDNIKEITRYKVISLRLKGFGLAQMIGTRCNRVHKYEHFYANVPLPAESNGEAGPSGVHDEPRKEEEPVQVEAESDSEDDPVEGMPFSKDAIAAKDGYESDRSSDAFFDLNDSDGD